MEYTPFYKRHTFAEMFQAIRPWSIPASAMPVLVVFCYSLWRFGWREMAGAVLPGAMTLAAAVLFQLAANAISDYFDYTRGVDTRDTFGSRMLPDRVFEPWEILLYGWLLLLAALGCGLFLLAHAGAVLLYFGLAGIVATVFYYVFKFNGLGALLIFIVFGPLIMLGTDYVLTGRCSPEVFALSFPVGMLTTAILHANDTRDLVHDRQAGIRTVAMLLRVRGAIVFHGTLILVPYLLIVCFVGLKILPALSLMVLPTLPLALCNVRSMARARTDLAAIRDLDQGTAKLQFVFSATLVVSLVLATFFA